MLLPQQRQQPLLNNGYGPQGRNQSNLSARRKMEGKFNTFSSADAAADPQPLTHQNAAPSLLPPHTIDPPPRPSPHRSVPPPQPSSYHTVWPLEPCLTVPLFMHQTVAPSPPFPFIVAPHHSHIYFQPQHRYQHHPTLDKARSPRTQHHLLHNRPHLQLSMVLRHHRSYRKILRLRLMTHRTFHLHRCPRS